MGIFHLFAGPATDKGVEEYEKTQGAVLLDVRTQQEYAAGHIPGSQNLPLGQLKTMETQIPKKDTPIFVYCYSGARSSQGAALLKQMGYQHVKNIGGIADYHGKVEA